MPEESFEDVFEPAKTGVVVHIIRNVRVEGCHERDFFGPSVLYEVQCSAVRACDMKYGWLEVFEFQSDLPGEGKAELVGEIGLVRIVKERDRNRVVKKEDTPIRVFTIQMRVLAISRYRRKDTN